MISIETARGFVITVLDQICPHRQFDAIDITPIHDANGPSLKFWAKHGERTVAEGQCYSSGGNQGFDVVEIYSITCVRRDSAATRYQAWFLDSDLIRLFHGVGPNETDIALIEVQSQLL